jgi:hypothetical protein
MTYHPTPEEIQHIMEITGMDYIQARNHLIGRQLVQQIAQNRRSGDRRTLDEQLSDN